MADAHIQLRIRIQETAGGVGGFSTDDYQLRYSISGGIYTGLGIPDQAVMEYNSANLTDGNTTTNRLGSGTGSFVAGKVSEDGVVDNLSITAGNYTELVYSITIVESLVSDGDTIDFRVYRNDTALDNYSVTPRITIAAAAGDTTTTKTQTGVARITASTLRTQTGKANILGNYLYKKGATDTLPTGNTFIGAEYSSGEYTDAATNDNVFVNETGVGYLLHQFKVIGVNNTSTIDIDVRTKSTVAPSAEPVYLQIYNDNTSSWETLSSNTSAAADTEFVLSGSKNTSLANYYNGSFEVFFRIYQHITGTITPAAPTSGVVDDTANTFDWTNNPDYTATSDYEYTTNGGTSYTDVTAKPINIGDVSLATGQVGVRVKAATGRNASSTLFSSSAFNAAGSNVTWTGTQNATISAPDITHSKAAYTMYANSVQNISSGSASSFSFKGADSTTSGFNTSKKQALMLSSGAPYTAYTGYKLWFACDGAGAWAIYKDGTYMTDGTGIVAGNTISMGFDASGHLQVKKNGTALWTDSAVTSTANYMLFITAGDEETVIKWENVTYQ